MIKLIAIDMDATFLRDDKTYDVALFKKVLHELTNRGILFVIASGNSINKLMENFDESDRKLLHFAGDNANMIFSNGEVERINAMPKMLVHQYIQTMHQIEGYYSLMTTASGVSYLVNNRVPEAIVQAYHKYNIDIRMVNSVLDVPDNEQIIKVASFGNHDHQTNKERATHLMTQFPSLSIVTSGEQWVDAFNANGGKGSGIQFFQQKFNLKKEECIAFGDSLNVYSMMREVGYAVAMENCDSELLSVCHYQIGSNNEQSVLNVLNEFIAEGESVFERYRK